MYLTLFDLAGLAAPAWLILIFLPTWRVTRWLARTAIVPALIALIYLAGVGLLVTNEGAGFMRDFGSAEGVTRLLARQDVAMVAWIHILAFDQLVGLFIYRDNMRYRYVPLPVQSVILFLTLMLGPAGFLLYYVLRLARGQRMTPGAVDRGDAGIVAPAEPVVVSAGNSAAVATPAFLSGGGVLALLRLGRDRMMMVRGLAITGIAGIVLGLFCFALIALRGGALVPPEGDLTKAATFDLAVGIYVLTLTFFVPGARFSPRGRSIWVGTTIGILLFSFPVETIQIMRGLDPRFSTAGSPTVQILGGVFFLAASGLVVLFGILTWKYFRKRDDAGSPLVLATRYAFAGVYAGFAAGFWLSANQGSEVAPAGSILPLHALGFHGLQAIPAVALFLMWAGATTEETRKWVHVAGMAWLAACGAVAVQTAAGRAPIAITPASIAAGAVLLVWAGVALFAFIRWARRSGVRRTVAG